MVGFCVVEVVVGFKLVVVGFKDVVVGLKVVEVL